MLNSSDYAKNYASTIGKSLLSDEMCWWTFTEEIKDTESLNVVQIEVSFCLHRQRGSDRPENVNISIFFWLLPPISFVWP